MATIFVAPGPKWAVNALRPRWPRWRLSANPGKVAHSTRCENFDHEIERSLVSELSPSLAAAAVADAWTRPPRNKIARASINRRDTRNQRGRGKKCSRAECEIDSRIIICLCSCCLLALSLGTSACAAAATNATTSTVGVAEKRTTQFYYERSC